MMSGCSVHKPTGKMHCLTKGYTLSQSIPLGLTWMAVQSTEWTDDRIYAEQAKSLQIAPMDLCSPAMWCLHAACMPEVVLAVDDAHAITRRKRSFTTPVQPAKAEEEELIMTPGPLTMTNTRAQTDFWSLCHMSGAPEAMLVTIY